MSSATETQPLIAMAKKDAEDSRSYLLKVFSFVPDDKLNWTPAPTAKSALRIVAHCAVCNDLFKDLIAGLPFPEGPVSEYVARREQREAEILTREAAIEALNESFVKVQSALDGMRPEDVEKTVVTPGITAPMTFLMFLPARHTDNHACQIDYLQTCWGDLEVHF